MANPPIVKSSPHSPDEDSPRDTPSTNLTAFTPDTGGTSTGPRPKFHILVAQPDGRTINFGTNVGTSSTDPFVTGPTPVSARSELSPTAEVFTPKQSIDSYYAIASATSNGSSQTVMGEYPAGHGRAFGAVGDSINDLIGMMRTTTLSLPDPGDLPFRDACQREGKFTNEEPITRAFMITNIPTNTPFGFISQQLNPAVYYSLVGINTAKLASEGVVVVGFANYRDARHAYMSIEVQNPSWQLNRLSPKSWACYGATPTSSQTNVALVSDFEGQVILSVYFNGRDSTIKARPTLEFIKQTLAQHGDVKAFHTLPYRQNNVREVRIEYYDVLAAEKACGLLKNAQFDRLVFTIEPYKPDVRHATHSQDGPAMQASFTGRSQVPIDDPAGAYRYHHYLAVPGNGVRGRNGRYDAGASHNIVDIVRIQQGLDVRTTIMLRNIPNKIDQAMLQEIINETSFGCYDFIYLRIDFANNCNVGYAFINFTDAQHIIPFAIARAGQRWNKFNSDKVAEISYATIQGKDCLISKFRNSSVMLEHPTFRPKLFIAGASPDTGKEEKFPEPDNPSKMRRSVENAEHVGLWRRSRKAFKAPPSRFISHNQRIVIPISGLRAHTTTHIDTSYPCNSFNGDAGPSDPRLFAPRQGQVYREEQRRRRSQFDRGTPGAEFEAYTQGLSDPALSPYESPPRHPISPFAPAMNYSPYIPLNFAPPPGFMPNPSNWYLSHPHHG